MKKCDFSRLRKKVIDRGLCTACGTCVGVCPAGVLQFDFARGEPVLEGNCTGCGFCHAACPGEDIPLVRLEEKFMGVARTPANELLGVSRAFLKGFAVNPEVRRTGASGGVTTALLLYALDRKLIDGAVVTTMDPGKPWTAKPLLARTRAELIDAAKSKYSLCPTNMALREIRRGERVAVVGLPCHIHGIRKLQSQKAFLQLSGKIVFTLGLLCGSNRSPDAIAHLIRESADVDLSEVERFEYRGGIDGQEMKIFSRGKREITVSPGEWRIVSQSMAKDRCRMCCDYAADLADLSLGDICHPQDIKKRIPNWNSLIVRTEKGERLVEEAGKAGVIETSPLEEASFYGNVGFEMKKHGSVYTFLERKRCGWPVPNYHYEFTWRAKRRVPYGVPEG